MMFSYLRMCVHSTARHGIRSLFHGRLPNEFRVAETHLQIGRRESCPLCLHVHFGQFTIIAVLYIHLWTK